jgi:hypothetical protein
MRPTKLICFIFCVLYGELSYAKLNSDLNVSIKRKYHNLYTFPLGASEIRESIINKSIQTLKKRGSFHINNNVIKKNGVLSYDIFYDKKNKHAKIKLSLLRSGFKKIHTVVKFSLHKLSQDNIFNKLEKMGVLLGNKFINKFVAANNVFQENKIIKDEFKEIVRPKSILSDSERNKVDMGIMGRLNS